jgi:hypothetical protein
MAIPAVVRLYLQTKPVSVYHIIIEPTNSGMHIRFQDKRKVILFLLAFLSRAQNPL